MILLMSSERLFIAIRLKIQTKSGHKIHKSQLLRLDFVNLKSWIAIVQWGSVMTESYNSPRPRSADVLRGRGGLWLL